MSLELDGKLLFELVIALEEDQGSRRNQEKLHKAQLAQDHVALNVHAEDQWKVPPSYFNVKIMVNSNSYYSDSQVAT